MSRHDILFLVRSLGIGGAERQLCLLALALHEQGAKVAVAVYYAGGAMEPALRASGVQVVDLRKAGRWSNLAILFRLWRLARELRPRVLHAYMPAANVVALAMRPALARLDCKVVCGIRIAGLDPRRYGAMARLLAGLHLRMLRRADCVISNSSSALREIARYVAPGRGHVIPNGVDSGRFIFSSEARSRQRRDWGVPDAAPSIGLIGRLDPQKNHAMLIDAVRLAGEGLADARIVFVGAGNERYEDEVRAHAVAAGVAGRIVWAGIGEDMTAVYSALDVVCLCSVAEGFPNVLVEAMCVGLPCVTTDVGDAATVVGDRGWAVPPGDAPALADALVQAQAALPVWDRAKSRKRAVAHFSIDALVHRTLDVLKPMMPAAFVP